MRRDLFRANPGSIVVTIPGVGIGTETARGKHLSFQFNARWFDKTGLLC